MMIAVIPILLMSVLLEGYSLHERFNDLNHSLIDRSRSLARQLAATSEYAVFSGNDGLLKRYLDATLAQRDVKRVVFHDGSGKTLMDSAEKRGTGEPIVAAIGPSNPVYEDQRSLWIYEPIVPTEIKLDNPGDDADAGRSGIQALGAVLIEVSKDRLNKSKTETLAVGLLITVSVCLVSLLIAFRVARKITGPIMELNRVIRGIGEGRLDARVGKFEVNELDRLAEGVNTMCRLLLEERGSLRVRIETATDEIRRKKEQAENASQEKSRFLAAAGHDLRQPLAAANLFIDALKLTQPTPKQDEIINRLDQSMSTFNGMLDALLNISKLDAGAVKPEYRTITVTELFTWLERNCQPLAGEKRLGFRLYFPVRETLAVHGDIGLVKSVLVNLVSNAIKYTSRGAILISVRRRGTDAWFQVWDTGVGIPNEFIKRIFDEFYQINNPQRDRTRGLGLGLSIARRALSVMGGEITCRSQVGRGTVFGFRLPLENLPRGAVWHAAVGAAREEPLDASFARGKRFVLVEDDSLVAQAMVNLLEGIGGEVKRFHNAEDVLSHPGIADVDCFISDYMLAGAQNGIQLLNQLRQKLGRPINAVLMTGDTSPAFMVELTDCAWTVLHKPVKLTDLMSSLMAQKP